METLFNTLNEKICYIVGACESGKVQIPKKKGDIVLCADGGLDILEKNNIKPDFVIGDFDSLGYIPKGENVFVYPKEKDDSDTGIAIKLGFQKGYKSFVIYGGLGGRFDHSFANVQLLSYIAENGGQGFLVGENTYMTVIKDSSLSLKGKGTISVFSLSDKSMGVALKGLKYTLENGELTNSFPLGLSNEFLNEETSALLRVQRGTLLVIVTEN